MVGTNVSFVSEKDQTVNISRYQPSGLKTWIQLRKIWAGMKKQSHPDCPRAHRSWHVVHDMPGQSIFFLVKQAIAMKQYFTKQEKKLTCYEESSENKWKSSEEATPPALIRHSGIWNLKSDKIEFLISICYFSIVRPFWHLEFERSDIFFLLPFCPFWNKTILVLSWCLFCT